MGESKRVRITLESLQDGVSHKHTFIGELFRKERSLYIRYSEQAQEDDPIVGEVRTLIRYGSDEMSITRRGAIESKQLFVKGGRRAGHFQSAVTAFAMEIETTGLHLSVDDGPAKELPNGPPFLLEWQYALYVNDEMAGRFHLRLHIQEDDHS